MVEQIQNGTPEAEEATLEKMRDEHKEQQATLESNADAVLAKLRGGATPDPEPEPNPEPDPEPEPDPDPQPEPEPKAEPEPDPEPESEPAGKEPDPAAESKLTQAEIRAALHLGWSEEEITELEQASPDLAKKTCAKALESTNNLSKKFSELGKTQATKKEEPAMSTPAVVPQPKPIDFTALETQYEGDPIVGVLKQVVEQSQAQATEITALRAAGPKVDAAVDAAQAKADAAVSQQLDVFFDGPEIAAYKDTYGAVERGSRNWDDLTQGQINKRYEVVEQADMIQKGAEQQGVDMPLDEAFERAHLLVTEDVREQTIRKSIKAKAVKREKGLTLAPSAAAKVPEAGKKTMSKTLENAARVLAKLRKGRN